MRLAYLAHRYPYPSHTFIRREIHELERRGHEVFRYALRADRDPLVDAADRAEGARTFALLEQPPAQLLGALLRAGIARPSRTLEAWRAAWALAPARRGRLRRALGYVLEAAVLARELERRGVRHLHAHFGTHPAAVAHVVHVLGVASYSLTVHGPEEFLPEFAAGLRRKIGASAFTAAISDYGAGRLAGLCDEADRAKIHVVRCGIGAGFLSAGTTVDPGARGIVCVGRLSARKGQLRLLEAAARLKRDGVAFALALVGDGEERGELEARVEMLGLREHVSLRGWADESQVRAFLLEARGVVVPSSDEGLPVVIVEALALGRPVIASRIAAIPELVRDGETGWLVSPDGVEDLVKALRELLDTPATRLDEMAARGRALVLERHTTESEVTRLEALFLKAVAT